MRHGLKEGHLIFARWSHEDGKGNVLWQSGWTPNQLADEGERMVLDVFLRNGTAPSNFRLRLFADTPVETDSLASLAGEPGGNTGYIPGTINRDATAAGWPTLENVGGDFEARSVEIVFHCQGPAAYPVVQYGVLATTSDNTGKLLDYVPLDDPRSLSSGEILRCIMAPKLS